MGKKVTHHSYGASNECDEPSWTSPASCYLTRMPDHRVEARQPEARSRGSRDPGAGGRGSPAAVRGRERADAGPVLMGTNPVRLCGKTARGAIQLPGQAREPCTRSSLRPTRHRASAVGGRSCNGTYSRTLRTRSSIPLASRFGVDHNPACLVNPRQGIGLSVHRKAHPRRATA